MRSDHHLPALDGIRGIAIVFVLVFHAWRSSVTALGWTGVDLFFVLSGFLITGILLDQREQPDRLRTFYVRRALRILPLYYGVLVVVLIIRPLLHLPLRRDDVLLSGEQVWYWSYLCAWRMAFHHPPGYTFLTHFWSLSIEEQFYLVWPVMVWRTTRRQLTAIAVFLCIVALAARVYFATATPWIEAAYMLPVCRIDALAVGALVAIAVRRDAVAAAPNSPVVLGTPPAWLGASAGLLGIVVVLAIAPSTRYTDPVMSTVGYTVIDWTAAAGIWLAVVSPPRWLSLTPLRLLGRYSYGLYVLHPFINWWAIRHAPFLERNAALFAFGTIGLSVACAVACYHLFERPFLRLKDRLASRPHMALTGRYA